MLHLLCGHSGQTAVSLIGVN